MKRLLACVLLLASLTACAGASSFDKHNCSAGGEVCIEVRADEPIFFGEPVTVTIKMTSEKDIPNIGVSLYHDVNVVVEGPQEWETESRDATIWESGASWKVSVEANRSMTFKRTLYLPLRDGLFYIIAGVRTSNLEAVDNIYIYMTREGGKVYLSGTPIPITPGPELVDTLDPILRATLEAMPTDTPYPTLTAVKATETPPPEVQGTPAYPPPERPADMPTTPPYP